MRASLSAAASAHSGLCRRSGAAGDRVLRRGVHPNAQLSGLTAAVNSWRIVATKEHRRHAKGLIEELETRVHLGPPIHHGEIRSAQEFLQHNGFSPCSDYFGRLGQIQTRVQTRPVALTRPEGKRNYGGEAAGRWMQLQCAYDHVILSTCYEGRFNSQPGRIKISHRFNEEGRIDFVELKFLRSLHACLDGGIRKLVMVKNYQDVRKDWHSAEAFVLEILPRELIFLYEDIFRCDKDEVLAWLVNVGHRIAGDLLADLNTGAVNGHSSPSTRNPDQLRLSAVRTDELAFPILESAAALESAVEPLDPKTVVLRYPNAGSNR